MSSCVFTLNTCKSVKNTRTDEKGLVAFEQKHLSIVTLVESDHNWSKV